jgi:RNA polymerase sigma factor (TIGR02999 family)
LARIYSKNMSHDSRILSTIESGDPHVAEQLLPLVYEELRALASQLLDREKPGQTLQATALVHEAYLRLVVRPKRSANHGELSWNSRGHFFAAAAEAMRRILVERARHKKSLKAGGDRTRVVLPDVEPAVGRSEDDIIDLDAALDKLAKLDLRKAELIKLRYFAGLTNEEAAKALGISSSTADNDWAYARSWLRLELTHGRERDEKAEN